MTLREAVLKTNIKVVVEDFGYEVAYLTQQFREGAWEDLCSVGATYIHQILGGKWSPSGAVLPLIYSPYANALTWRVIISDEAIDDLGKLAECELVMPTILTESQQSPDIAKNLHYSVLIVLLSIWDAQHKKHEEG